MRMHKQDIIAVTLARDGLTQPWGFRMKGGADLGEILEVSRVFVGTPSEGELHRGDRILGIANQNTNNLTHQDAHTLIKNAGNTISLVIQRAGQGGKSPSFMPSSVKPPIAGGVPTPFAAVNHSPVPDPSGGPTHKVSTVGGAPKAQTYSERIASPVDQLPATVFPELLAYSPVPIDPEVEERIAVTSQPYRTIPLVQPGAKVKRSSPGTASFLKYQASPTMRGTPSPTSGHAVVDAVNENLMKQKVKETLIEKTGLGPMEDSVPQVVNKQFNSPINAYSGENIQEAIAAQTGMTPVVEESAVVTPVEPTQNPEKVKTADEKPAEKPQEEKVATKKPAEKPAEKPQEEKVATKKPAEKPAEKPQEEKVAAKKPAEKPEKENVAADELFSFEVAESLVRNKPPYDMKSSETYKAVLELEPPSTERKQKPKTDIDPGEESIKVKTYDTEYGWHGQGEDGKRPLTEEEKFKQHVSMMGQHKNKIAQSHSFKRIMMDLLTEDLNI